MNGTGIIQNSASVAQPAGQTDPWPGNHSSSVTVTGSNEADLRLTKAASISPVVPGQNYNWNITVRNTGPLAAAPGQFIDVTETIPAGLTVSAAPSSAGRAGVPARKVERTVGGVAAGRGCAASAGAGPGCAHGRPGGNRLRLVLFTARRRGPPARFSP